MNEYVDSGHYCGFDGLEEVVLINFARCANITCDDELHCLTAFYPEDNVSYRAELGGLIGCERRKIIYERESTSV